VSLNSVDPEQYGRLMRLDGPRFHAAMLEFVGRRRIYIPSVVVSVVGMSEIDQAAARELVEKGLVLSFEYGPTSSSNVGPSTRSSRRVGMNLLLMTSTKIVPRRLIPQKTRDSFARDDECHIF